MANTQTATPNAPPQIIAGPPAQRNSTCTPREFLARLTQAEKLAIRTAAQTNASVAVWIDDLLAATEVDLDHPDTVAGLGAMSTAGLLTAARVQAIRGLP